MDSTSKMLDAHILWACCVSTSVAPTARPQNRSTRASLCAYHTVLHLCSCAQLVVNPRSTPFPASISQAILPTPTIPQPGAQVLDTIAGWVWR
eukprot:15477837-Alexandrium_andersonii.AAC.1